MAAASLNGGGPWSDLLHGYDKRMGDGACDGEEGAGGEAFGVELDGVIGL